MAIRFACANCGKYHRIPDDQAGLPGRCGKCKHRFIAPGNPVAQPSPVFVTTARPNLNPTRHRKRRDGPGSAVLIGGLLAIIAVLLIFDYRDQIVAALPALAPALPSKAPERRVVAPALVAGPVAPAIPSSDDEWPNLTTGLQITYVVAWIFGGMIAPVVVPPILSRRGFLSVGRWLIMGATIAILAVGNTILILAFLSKLQALGTVFGALLALLIVPFYFSFVGCFLAAAIHPKATNATA